MRTKVISGTTVEYPDLIGFAFLPCVVNIRGVAWSSVEAVVTCRRNGDSHSEEREMFGDACFFDLSHYIQGAFDDVEFGVLGYGSVEDTKLGALFDVELIFYQGSSVMDSMAFQTFFVWGAMQVGERYNGERNVTWFKNFPFTVGMYSGAEGSAKLYMDYSLVGEKTLSTQGVWNVSLNGYSANDSAIIVLNGADDVPATFDNTFDYTFKAIAGGDSKVVCKVDDSDRGIYLRWVNRHGFYCYWLFTEGDESRKVANDGEFLRNNMLGYNFKNGYNGGTGRNQRKTGENLLPVCAPSVDSEMFDFLFELALSPVVDMYMGKDDNGTPAWMRVNISVGTFTKSRKVLQDFICTIVLPETRVQSL